MIMFRMTHEAIVRKMQVAHAQEMDVFEAMYNQLCEQHEALHKRGDTATHLLQAALILLGTVDTKRSGGQALRERIAALRQQVQAHGFLPDEQEVEYYVVEGAMHEQAIHESEETA